MSHQTRYWYDYAVIRVVPRVERGEQVNVGVVMLCREADFLGIRLTSKAAAIRALDPAIDMALVGRTLEAIRRVAAGDPEGGPMARLSKPERFHWLTSPRSTVVQPSEVHTGRCDEPEAALDELFSDLVA